MIFTHDDKYEKALTFSRLDKESVFSTASRHSFTLDERHWPTAEHYYQANKFPGTSTFNKMLTVDANQAHKLGNAWWRPKRKGWKSMRTTIMTRALYSKCQQNPEVKAALLATGDQLIAETSAYDHFWGLGRDLRGKNQMGKIWMNIRDKIRTDEKEA